MLQALAARIRRTWGDLTPRARVHLVLLLLITVGAVGHHAALFNWYIEDAAIDFAYAKHFVAGEGLVPYPGAERTEGYSNPLWLAILIGVQAVGLDLFAATHWVQLAICVATVPVVYLAAREASGPDSDVPLVSTAFLASCSQFAIWGASGLENGLLSLLFALGLWRMLVELRTGRWPWSALVWCGVALTRPEGIVYAAIAGACSMVFQLHAYRVWPTLAWLATFFVPWGAYQVWHYDYFAWFVPNTYYAKLDKKEAFYEWNRRPWTWTRSFFLDMGQGFFLPVWLLGLAGDGRPGSGRWRIPVLTAAFLGIGLVVQLPGDQRFLLPVVVGALWVTFWLGLRATEERPPPWLVGIATLVAGGLVALSELLRAYALKPNLVPVPDLTKDSPPWVLAALALMLPLLALGTRGWQARVVSWLFCCAATFFAVYANGDWMKGYRWYAMAAVPGAILFGFGVDGLVAMVEDMAGVARRTTRWTIGGMVLALALVLLQLPANVRQTYEVATEPDPSPRGIRPRIDYVDRLRDRLHWEPRLVDLDVDMGAHLYWSDFEMMDIAGLVDLPFAHHRFEKEFVREYVFVERKPPYAHVHGNWASHSKIPTFTEWRRDYVEVPGYPAGRTQLHPGNFVRRDTFLTSGWPHGADGRVLLEDGVILHGVQVPSEPASGREVYLEVGIASTKVRRTKKEDDVRVLLFADDGTHFHSWDLAPGYDWLGPSQWHADEVFHGRYTLPLPPEDVLPPGAYTLGMVVLRPDGSVSGPATGEDRTVGPAARIGGEKGEPVRFAAGEVRWPGALVLLSVDDRAKACTADWEAALASAEARACEDAERSWFLARKHRAGEDDWIGQHLPRMNHAFAECWATSADGVDDRDDRVRRLVKAREWDWHAPAYRTRAKALADELYADGLALRAEEDWEAAYRVFSDCVDVDRTRAWCRRYAEEARAFRLGIDPASLARREAEQAERARAAAERRKEFEQAAGDRKDAPDEEEQ